MAKEYTVEERAAIVKKASGNLKLNAKHSKQVSECLYTLRESGDLDRLDVAQAKLVFQVVIMVMADKFTEEMSL